MAYRIDQVSGTIHIIRPKHWWSSFTHSDLAAALSELSDVRAKDIRAIVFRSLWWFAPSYIVITGRE